MPWSLAFDDDGDFFVFNTLTGTKSRTCTPIHTHTHTYTHTHTHADFLFLADVLKNFNTGLLDDMDWAVMDRKKITTAYLTGWFLPDLVSSIPIDLLIIAFEPDGGSVNFKFTKVLKMLRLLRMTKILRVFRLGRLAVYFNFVRTTLEDRYKITMPEGMLALCRLTLYLFILIHWIGCINFMICKIHAERDSDGKILQFPDESWVHLSGLANLPKSQQYSWCLFKAMAQMIGLGFEIPPIVNTQCVDIADPWCESEHWITLMCLYIGFIYYALVISNLSYIVGNMNRGRSALRDKIWTVNEYMRSKKTPALLRDKVRNFYKIAYGEGKMYDEHKILNELTPNLKEKILAHNRRHLFDLVPLIERAPSSFREKVSEVLQPRVHFSGEFIFKEGSYGDEMYFIHAGFVEIQSRFVVAGNVKAIAGGGCVCAVRVCVCVCV